MTLAFSPVSSFNRASTRPVPSSAFTYQTERQSGGEEGEEGGEGGEGAGAGEGVGVVAHKDVGVGVVAHDGRSTWGRSGQDMRGSNSDGNGKRQHTVMVGSNTTQHQWSRAETQVCTGFSPSTKTPRSHESSRCVSFTHQTTNQRWIDWLAWGCVPAQRVGLCFLTVTHPSTQLRPKQPKLS